MRQRLVSLGLLGLLSVLGAPAAASTAGPGSDSPPLRIAEQSPPPAYPASALRKGERGVVLLKVMVDHEAKEETSDTVERLMGTKAEARFAFISDKAEFASEELLDV